MVQKYRVKDLITALAGHHMLRKIGTFAVNLQLLDINQELAQKRRSRIDAQCGSKEQGKLW